MKFYIGKRQNLRYEAFLVKTERDRSLKTLTLLLACYQINEQGNMVQMKGIEPYHCRLIANNTTGVDAAGNYVNPYAPDFDTYPQTENDPGGYPPDSVLIGSRRFPAGTVGEWDFFANISANVPVVIDNMELAVLEKNRARLMPDELAPDPEEEV